MAYGDKVIDHYENPRNVGNFGTTQEVKKNPLIGVGLVGAPECGDVMQLQIRVDAETGLIDDARFKCFGCGSAIASPSLTIFPPKWLKSVREAMSSCASTRPESQTAYPNCWKPRVNAPYQPTKPRFWPMRSVATSPGWSGRASARRSGSRLTL